MIKRALTKVLEKISDLYYVINSEIEFQVERIIGCWDYLRFIWTHNSYREWDYDYMYELMMFKLERMAKQLRNDTFVERSEDTYNQIMETLNYYKMYQNIEAGETDCLECFEDIRTGYAWRVANAQKMWDKFHDSLRDNSRYWWS